MGAPWHDNRSSHWVLQKLLRKNGDFAICSEQGFVFAKEVPKVHCKTLKTIDAHKLNHIITPNQFMVECESSIPSLTDMGKPTLTIVDQSLTGAVEIQNKFKKM